MPSEPNIAPENANTADPLLKSAAATEKHSLLSSFANPNPAEENDTSKKAVNLTKKNTSGFGTNTLRQDEPTSTSSKLAKSKKEEMISMAKELLKRAGTSIDEIAAANREPNRGFIGDKAKPKFSEIANAPKGILEKLNTTKPEDPFQNKDFNTENPDEVIDNKDVNSAEITSDDIISERSRRVEVKVRNSGFHYFGLVSFLALGALIAFIGYKFINGLISDDVVLTEEDIAEITAPVEEAIAPDLLQPISEDSPLLTEARSVISDYFKADSKRFAYTFIIPNNSSNADFSKYWEPTAEFSSDSLVYNEGFTLPNNSHWTSFTYGEGNERLKVILKKMPNENFKIDWQTLSEIEGRSLADAKSEIQTAPFVIRAWLTSGDYNSISFSDSYWNNLVAKDVNGTTLNTYIAKESKDFEDINRAIRENGIRHPKGASLGVYTKILVKKAEIGADHVQILDVLSTSWTEDIDKLRDN